MIVTPNSSARCIHKAKLPRAPVLPRRTRSGAALEGKPPLRPALPPAPRAHSARKA